MTAEVLGSRVGLDVGVEYLRGYEIEVLGAVRVLERMVQVMAARVVVVLDLVSVPVLMDMGLPVVALTAPGRVNYMVVERPCGKFLLARLASPMGRVLSGREDFGEVDVGVVVGRVTKRAALRWEYRVADLCFELAVALLPMEGREAYYRMGGTEMTDPAELWRWMRSKPSQLLLKE
jgi:hypothetical protein